MIDPLERWACYGEKPDYAGLLTFAGQPYTQDPSELPGHDVAIVGAPFDDLVSDRPGARFAPRAIRAASCPPGPHLEAKVDAFAQLRVVDFGDAPVVPADPVESHRAIEETVRQVLTAGAIPVILGGDHSVTRANIRACAAVHGPVGVVHFDTHTDTGKQVFGVTSSHGTFMRQLLDDGHVDGPRYVQIGLRGYWPGEAEFAWQAERGITSSVHARRARPGDRRDHPTGDRDRRNRRRCSSPSTSTCSRPRLSRAPGRPSPAACRPSISCCRCARWRANWI